MTIERKQIQHAVISLLVVLVNYVADQASKHWAVVSLKGKGVIKVIGDFFILVYAENTGAFLSAGAGWPSALKYILLLILPLVLCIFGLYYIVFKEKRLGRAIVLACIIGGGLGNLIDRLFNNFIVVDFLNFGIGRLRTGVLNIADISVTFGAIAYIIAESMTKKADAVPAQETSPSDIDSNK